MKTIVALNASPNKDGLTAACAVAFLVGAEEAGAAVKLLHLADYTLLACQACERGWGKCRAEGVCVLTDDFEEIRTQILSADAWALATPVYFGEPSERARVFLDRLRRCNTAPSASHLRGKDFVGICAAGGSGRGIGLCADVLERFSHHMGLRVADLILVTRRNKLYKVDTLKAVGRALIQQPWDE